LPRSTRTRPEQSTRAWPRCSPIRTTPTGAERWCSRWSGRSNTIPSPVDCSAVWSRRYSACAGHPGARRVAQACAERIRHDQLAGTVRPDIDPATIGNGFVAIILSLLMSVVQLGEAATMTYATDVAAMFAAALDRKP